MDNERLLTKDKLLDNIDYVQARIEELDDIIIQARQTDKGYKEVIDVYNKWTDQYRELMTKLEHFDDADIEKEKLELEKMRLNLERDKQTIMQQIEQDKINVETEKLRLDREKFACEIEVRKRDEIKDIIFEAAEIGIKLAVPLIAVVGTIGVAKLSYMNEEEFKLCNGRVYGEVKDLLKIVTMKV